MANVSFTVHLASDEREDITVQPAAHDPEDVSIRVSSGQAILCTREQARKLYSALNAHLYTRDAMTEQFRFSILVPEYINIRVETQAMEDGAILVLGDYRIFLTRSQLAVVANAIGEWVDDNSADHGDDPGDGVGP